MKKVIIIGSGVGGLAMAIKLKLQGHETHVFEANGHPGGKLNSFQENGYRFDTGPSLFTMPQYVDDLFIEAGKNPKDFFQYKACEEACRYFWEDGTQINAYSDIDEFANEVAIKLKYSKTAFLEYFTHVRRIYANAGKIFLERTLHKLQSWISIDVLHALIKIRHYDLLKSMHLANKKRLKEPHLVQLFDRFATYNGSNPYKAPGILNVIPWLEHGFGTYFPRGGMKSIPYAMHNLASELGVQFHFSQKVEEIIVEHQKVKGVSVDGVFHSADLVVSNMDIHFTYSMLLPNISGPKRVLQQEPSSSAMVFYWGVNRQTPQLGLHNILFSEDYEAEFSSIFEKHEISDDPTVYINITSKMDASDAPEGCENWFVMVNAPHHKNQNWKDVETKTRSVVLQKISRVLGFELESHIVTERSWNPQGIERDTLSYKGALYGNSSNSKLAAFLRHPNFSSQVQNLYFCGGSVHPGGGIPLAILSAQITSELIRKG